MRPLGDWFLRFQVLFVPFEMDLEPSGCAEMNFSKA